MADDIYQRIETLEHSTRALRRVVVASHGRGDPELGELVARVHGQAEELLAAVTGALLVSVDDRTESACFLCARAIAEGAELADAGDALRLVQEERIEGASDAGEIVDVITEGILTGLTRDDMDPPAAFGVDVTARRRSWARERARSVACMVLGLLVIAVAWA